jgi:hypothetical protein
VEQDHQAARRPLVRVRVELTISAEIRIVRLSEKESLHGKAAKAYSRVKPQVEQQGGLLHSTYWSVSLLNGFVGLIL